MGGSQMLCPGCRSENPNGKLFCGDCGTPLNANFESPLRRMIDQSLSGRFQDQKLVEIETAVAITSRLQEWLKLFAFFVALPFIVILDVLGVTSYEQFANIIHQQENKVLGRLSKAETRADGVLSQAEGLAGCGKRYLEGASHTAIATYDAPTLANITE
jgi:hypothetical protein